ncbi:hypothetical protein H8693_08385 [Christensenellaceae bacterium NSJ-63]|uniref:Uncharacterized protein n=1 Tax=Guopingia tenuis TaxID=2763656 RepID=A0A926DKK0_9FIRM|nr:hypothetical protein [Guopingia tenuis]MBC8538949.1 hypothetical protein [Guopingia tenuis]
MNEKRATYGKGALGAFVGALAGFAAWCIVAYFVGGNLHLSFGFVLALLVYLGYTGMNGKNGRGAYLIYIAFVLAVGFAAYLVASGMIAVNETVGAETMAAYAEGQFGGNAFAAYFSLLGDGIQVAWEGLATGWTNLAIAVIFEAAGGAYFLLKLHDAVKEQAADAGKKTESAENRGSVQEEEPEENAGAEGEPAQEEEEAAEEAGGQPEEGEI